MTLLGLDFDNTLVRYDKLFHQLAVEKGLIDQDLQKNKESVKRSCTKEVEKKNSQLSKASVWISNNRCNTSRGHGGGVAQTKKGRSKNGNC